MGLLFQEFPQYFGDTISWLVPIGLILMLCSKRLDQRLRFALAGMFILEVLFFSFIAIAKIYSFLVPVLPIGYIAISYTVACILKHVRLRAAQVALSVVLFFLICNLSLQWGKIEGAHSPDYAPRKIQISNAYAYQNLSKFLSQGTSVIVNAPQWDDVKIMFYNNDLIAHSYCPSESDFAIYRNLNLRVAYFESRPGYQVPDYVRNYRNAYPVSVHLE